MSHGFPDYPKADSWLGGCRVKFLYYLDEAMATKASGLARAEGEKLERLGYDFGFEVPGRIAYVAEGFYAGNWQVTVP